MNTKNSLTLIVGVMLAFSFAALSLTGCDMGDDPVIPTTPPEYLPDASRWESDYDRSTGVTIAHSVDDDDLCTITVSGTAIDALPAWDNIWKAYATYQYTAEKGKTYVYTFEAWTESGERTMNVQWYTDNVNAVYQNTGYENELATFTITSEPTVYTIKPSDYEDEHGDKYGPIPKSGLQWLTFHCANQTGKFYVKVISIGLPDSERWSTWKADDSTATIDISVDSDDVCAITVGGTAMDALPAWDNVWKVNAGYQYTAVAGKIYTFEFEAWTDGPDRTMTIQWYTDNTNTIYHNTGYDGETQPAFTITSERKTYTITGKAPIPKSGVQILEFQCANQTGKFNVKILSITGISVVLKNITITGITGKTGYAQILVWDDNNDLVAWGEGRISGNAVSLKLKQIVEGEYEGGIAFFFTDDPWYGSGSYYLELETDSQPNEYGGFDYQTFYFYTGGQADTTRRKYTITSATSTIPFSQFADSEGGGGVDPGTPITIYTDTEIFAMANTEYAAFLNENPAIPTTDPINGANAEMVKRVGQNIAAAAQKWLESVGQPNYLNNYEWQYELVEDDQINAWCMPGGRIVVYTGILPVTETEDALAIVMGHEVCHAILNHGKQRMSAGILQQLGGAILGAFTDSQLIMAAYGVTTNLAVTLPFSRKHESEADEYGLILAAIAGYKIEEAPGFWQRMADASGSKPAAYLSTHNFRERADALNGLILKAKAKAAELNGTAGGNSDDS